MLSKRKRSLEPALVRKAWKGSVEVTTRDRIRAEPPENLQKKVHKISVQPVQSVDASPPPGQTFIWLERRSPLNLLQQLREQGAGSSDCGGERQQAQGQLTEKLIRRLDELETEMRNRDEMWEAQVREMKTEMRNRDETWEAQLREVKTEIHELQFYADLFTTREQVAYNLLKQNIQRHLDDLLPSCIQRIASSKNSNLFNVTGYKGLLNADYHCTGNGLEYKEALVAVENEFVKRNNLEKEFEKKEPPEMHQPENLPEKPEAVKPVLDTTDIREAMRKVCRSMRTKRVAGAHAFEKSGLNTEDRRLVLNDLNAAIAGGPDNFRATELKDPKVLKLLKICCRMEEQRLGD